MKKTVLVIALALTTVLSVNAQTDHFDKVVPLKKKQVFVTQQEGATYVVEMPNKTKEELYEMVMLAISNHWVNPDEVIDGKLSGSYIKVGGAATMYGVKVLGIVTNYFTKIHYNFRFKDNKFMYTFYLDFRIPPSQYSAGGTYKIDGIMMTKKNGKTTYEAKYKDLYNNEVNSFIKLIKSQELSSSDDDW